MMEESNRLERQLQSVEGKDYAMYQSLKGIEKEYVEVRFFMGLPSSGRDIASLVAKERESSNEGAGPCHPWFQQYMNGSFNVKEIICASVNKIKDEGIDALDPHLTGDIVMFRSIELASAMNRMRGLEFRKL